MEKTTPHTQKINLVELAKRAAKLAADSAALVEDLAVAASNALAPTGPRYVTSAEALAEYGMGPGALTPRGIRRVKRGRSWVWSVDDIERVLADGAKPPKPRPPKKTQAPEGDQDELDQLLASGQVRR